ncbi:hypothetical protein HCU40_19930 (plasmid) [Pseudanabaena biceps]|nr:hypothetical protein [Pseudanabaena biceps]
MIDSLSSDSSISEKIFLNSSIDKILRKYAYIDLEVDLKEEIHRIGSASLILEQDFKVIESTQTSLESLRDQGLHICGHNFRRFDYKYLITRFPTLDPWVIIDTLELSIIAFPLERSLHFYTTVLSCQKISDIEIAGLEFDQLYRLPNVRLRVVKLKLGDEMIELIELGASQFGTE